MSQPTQEEINEMSTLAVIIDSEVVDIITASDRFVAILLSNPKFVDITNKKDNEGHIIVRLGATYNEDNDTFTNETISIDNV